MFLYTIDSTGYPGFEREFTSSAHKARINRKKKPKFVQEVTLHQWYGRFKVITLNENSTK